MKTNLLMVSLLVGHLALSQTIKCANGFFFDMISGKMSMNYNSLLAPYLYANATKVYFDNLTWSHAKKAFVSSSTRSSVWLYPYKNGERAFSLKAKSGFYSLIEYKIDKCDKFPF
jgi:hypothetical protein